MRIFFIILMVFFATVFVAHEIVTDFGWLKSFFESLWTGLLVLLFFMSGLWPYFLAGHLYNRSKK